MDNSLVSGGTRTIREGFVLGGASELGSGSCRATGMCAGVYDENDTFYPRPSCP